MAGMDGGVRDAAEEVTITNYPEGIPMSEQAESTRSELEREFVEIARGLRESSEEGKEFVVQEAPLVVQEYIDYRWFVDTTIVVVCLSCLLMAVVAVVRGWYKVHSTKWEHGREPWGALCFAGLIATVLLLPLSVAATQDRKSVV